MRPLELKVKGLRSYHAERTIPLADESLLAIVGDTGAGKSSLLEAIVFALYAGSTWDGREASELISDRTRNMVVELAFKAEGETWRVRRTMSSGSRPAEHELVCTSNPDKARADGAHAVNREIKKLIGLTREQFCTAVLLPQGRFEQLLHATPGERVDVLKGLLGLERVSRIREQADQLRQLLAERVIALADRRGLFMPDPQRAADDARRRIDELEPEMNRFEGARRDLLKADEDAKAKEDQATSLGQRAEALEPRMTGEAAKLDVLDQREQEIAERRKPLVDELRVVEDELQHTGELVEATKRERRDKVTLDRAIDALDAAHTQLDRLDNDQLELDKLIAETDDQREALHGAEQQLPTLESALSDASAAAEAAAAEVTAEEARQAQLGNALAELKSKLGALELADQQLANNQRAIESAADTERQRQTDLVAAADVRERVEVERDRLVALAPVASLAHDCHPGDPCPVCQRELPDGFQPPSAEGLDGARAAYNTAQEAERNAQRALADVEAELKQLQGAQVTLHETRDNAINEAASAEAAVRQVTGDLDGLEGSALLVTARDQAEADERALDELRKTARSRTTEFDKRKDDRDKLASSVDTERKLLESRDVANQRESHRIVSNRQQVLGAVATLTLPLVVPPAPTTSDVEEALTTLRELLPAAEQLESRHQELLTRSQECHRNLAELDAEFQRDVREPVIAARSALESVRSELERLSVPSLPSPPELDVPARELAAWAETIEQALASQLQSLHTRAEALRGEAQTLRDDALAQLALLGFASREHFEGRYDDLRSDLRLARRDLAQAEVQLAPVATLDDLRQRTEAMRTAFSDLYELLLDRNFVQYAVANRQRVMLAAASLVLQEVTGGHYGFSADFRIVDNETGQARAPRTLSGGESFLASLSLALGLVEATARSGGRLDALFLDEGFGSLDPNALQQALTALERRAEAGRLVAVISHVPLVAEQIERVLHVTRAPDGSDVRFMTASERGEMAFADTADSAF